METLLGRLATVVGISLVLTLLLLVLYQDDGTQMPQDPDITHASASLTPGAP
jgi:hypothetical protein